MGKWRSMIVDVKSEVEMVVCQCLECEHAYVLYGVVGFDHEGNPVEVIDQTSGYYCPYCGVKHSECSEVRHDDI
jgi:DNA-directed RNA polymerase subunit RPC12/RpoP